MSSSDDDAPAPVLPLRKRRRVITKNMVSSEPTKLFSIKLKPALNQAEQSISKILQESEKLQKESEKQKEKKAAASDDVVITSVTQVTPSKKNRSSRSTRQQQRDSDDSDQSEDDDVIIIESPKKVLPVTPPAANKFQGSISNRALERKRKKLLSTCTNVANVFNSISEPSLNSLEDDDELSLVECYELTPQNQQVVVKVRYLAQVYRFHTGRNESFQSVFQRMTALSESSSTEDLYISLGEKRILPEDTPSAIDLSVADIMDCLVVDRNNINRSPTNNSEEWINIHFQNNFEKVKKTYSVCTTLPLKDTLHQYAQDIGIARKKLVFESDGERVNDTSTPLDMELEDDYCIDVKRKNPTK